MVSLRRGVALVLPSGKVLQYHRVITYHMFHTILGIGMKILDSGMKRRSHAKAAKLHDEVT